MAAGDEIQPVVKKGDGVEHQDPHKKADLKAADLQVGKVPGGTDQNVASIVPKVDIGDPNKFGQEAQGVRHVVANALNLNGRTDMSPDAIAQRQAQLAALTDAHATVLNATSPEQLRSAQALVAGLDQSLPLAQAALMKAQGRLDALQAQLGRTASA